ncbi:galactokinase family protein [Buchananella hordeovulneris]|uniref:galactokinase family protein n=1 Tax=Buchananella hordeovulneris TaxID=52770 RepID=UPI000AB67BA1|nr:galactokinase family protein [Buchananella hordeovulneris]
MTITPLSAPAEKVTWTVPGRIEVLGKHTDYAGGRSLLAASDVGITFAATAIDEPVLRVTSEAIPGEVVEVPFAAQHEDRHGHWSGYPAAVAARLATNFPTAVRGAQIHVSSTLPLASGMSSSSAMIVGLARCLIDIAGIESTDVFRDNITTLEQYAAYLACIENGQSFGDLAGHAGVGTFGGSEDHTAMLCCTAGELSQYSFCPTRYERRVPFPTDHTFVIAVSGVLAEKSGQARELYNRASLSTREIVALWNKAMDRHDIYLASAVRSQPDAPEIMRKLLGRTSYLRGRFEQFLAESESLVPAAADALAAHDLAEFGRLVDQSQTWTEEGLSNQVPQTISLHRLARSSGAVAASAFGAGFGGSVWALVPSGDAEDFAARWLAEYQTHWPEEGSRASTIITRPGQGVQRTVVA